MFPIEVGDAKFSSGRCVGIEHSDIQKFSLKTISLESIYCDVHAPSALLEVSLDMVSPVSGCRSGSAITLWHTSVSGFVVMSRISL